MKEYSRFIKLLEEVKLVLSTMDNVTVKISGNIMSIRLKDNDIVIIAEPLVDIWYEYEALKGIEAKVVIFNTGNIIEKNEIPTDKIILKETINQYSKYAKSVPITEPVDKSVIDYVVNELKNIIDFYS